MQVYKNFNQIMTLEKAFKKDGRHLLPEDLGLLNEASIVFNEKEIIWVGATKTLPQQYHSLPSTDFSGHVLTPGLVDCHTHIVFGGDRSKEYTMRLNGADYEAIGKAGGGILATMKGTNDLNSQELYDLAKERVERLLSYGIKTIEIKSGYGLNFEKEKEITFVIDQLKKDFKNRNITILNTFMAAHAIPKEYESSQDYLKTVVFPLLKELSSHNIIDCVDIFHERGYFNTEDVKALFDLSQELGIPVKSHADEFQDNKGALLASQYKALSCDHLLCTQEDGIKALAESKTVAVLLPGTGFFLGKPQADGHRLLKSGCKVAIGSDYNPGSCHYDNLLQVASLAAPHYQMNICELWSAITLNAAHALGLRDYGALIPGFKPIFSLFHCPSIDHITYSWGRNFALS